MTEESKAVAKQDHMAVSKEMADLFTEDAGAGTEGITPDDIQLPMLKQVQDISDERDEDAPEYIEGADSGDFFNSVTRDLYKGDLEIIPCSLRKTIVAFTPRSQGGGFLGEFDSKEQAIDYLEEPAELKETTEIAVLYRPADDDDAAWRPAIMPMTMSKLKPARALQTQLLTLRVPVGDKKIQPPIFGTIFIMSSQRAKGKKGSYRNVTFRFDRLVQDADVMKEAKEFGEVMKNRDLRQGTEDEMVFGEWDDEDLPEM